MKTINSSYWKYTYVVAVERSGIWCLERIDWVASEILQWWQSTNETFGHTLMEKEKYILI